MVLKKHKKEVFIVFIIICAAVLLRFVNITMPILEGTATRQTQTAMIARNFYLHGLNILYPEVDFHGPGSTFYILEFPLLNFITAVLYRISGGVHEWMGRLLSILSFAGAGVFIYLIAKRLYQARVGIYALIVYSLSPVSIIFSRAFMPDFFMIFFCMGGLYFILSWQSEEKAFRFWISSIFVMMAMLVKPHSFYILVPILFLIWNRKGWKAILDYKVWSYLLISILPAALWYIRAGYIQLQIPTHGLINYQLSNWFDPKVFLSKDFYKILFTIITGSLLTPVGFTLFIIGPFVSKTSANERFSYVWLMSIILFYMAFNTHMDDDYYHLSLLPIASVFIAKALNYLVEGGLFKRGLLVTRWGKALGVIIIGLIITRYALYAYIVPDGYRYIPEAGQRIQEISRPDELVIASAGKGPAMLYYCQRKGWSFSMPGPDEKKTETAIEKLEAYRAKGANYLICAYMDEFNKSAYFKEYLNEHYSLLKYKEGAYIIYNLKS